MEVVWVLVPFAIFLGGFFLAGFFWMTNRGQYDDLESPQLRMLLDDQKSEIKNKQSHNQYQPNSNKERQ
ncbi:MAG: cbb3-type cytochrome oxidase assembly protein CcoS [Bacteriovoracaceae bacterium]|nr:cbb3-type cytochrome oxidase assembly protein CcoS [Bacteriovoracaceae bacterium]